MIEQPTIEEIQEIQNAVIDSELARLSQDDFKCFCEYVGRDEATEENIKLSAIHNLMIDFVDYCISIDKFALLEMPWEHGKSSIFSVLYPLHRIGKNPNLTIKLVSGKEDVVKIRVKQIRDYIDGKHGGVYNRVFPNIRADRKAGYSNFQIHVEREVSACPTIWAHSVLSSAEGPRCGLLLLDDCITRANSLSKDYNQVVIDAIEGSWMKRLHPDGMVIMLNTPFSQKDAVAHITKSRLERWCILKVAVNKSLDGYDVTTIGD